LEHSQHGGGVHVTTLMCGEALVGHDAFLVHGLARPGKVGSGTPATQTVQPRLTVEWT
jgi:hypothetical protein